MDLMAADRAEYCPDNPLLRDDAVDEVAQERSVAMATQGVYAPSGLLGISDRLHAHGVELHIGYVASENAGRANSVEGLETLYWNYEQDGEYPMRGNITDCTFSLVAIAIAADNQGRYWGTQTFVDP